MVELKTNLDRNNSMNWTRFFIAFIAAFIFLFVFGFLWYGTLMQGAHHEVPTLLRPEADFKSYFGWLILGHIVFWLQVYGWSQYAWAFRDGLLHTGEPSSAREARSRFLVLLWQLAKQKWPLLFVFLGLVLGHVLYWRLGRAVRRKQGWPP